MNEAQKAQERREARAQAKQANVQASLDQEVSLAALHDRLVRAQKGEQTDEDREIEDGIAEKKRAVAPPQQMARKDIRAAQLAVTERQAELDAARTVAPLSEEPVDLSAYAKKGIDVPLHELNRLARQADNAIRDEARTVAQVVGKAAYDELSGRRDRSHESRQKTISDAMRGMEKAKALANQKTA